MQINCPKCRQPLKLAAKPGQAVFVKCPKCDHGFQTTLPASVPAGTPEPDFSSAFQSLPQSTPATTFRQTAVPAPRKSSSRGSAASRGAKSKLSKTPVVAASLGGVIVVLLVAGGILWTQRDRLANRVGRTGSDTGASSTSDSFLGSLVPKVFRSDTPEIIFDEYFELQKEALDRQVSLASFSDGELESYRVGVKQTNQESRELLHRALALPPCTEAQFEVFKKRSEEFAEISKTRMKSHFDGLSEAQQERYKKGGLLGEDSRTGVRYSLMLINFLTRGFQEVAEQEGEQSKVYAKEVDVLRRLNRFMADVDADGIGSDSAATLEGFADELSELAAERSAAEGGGMFVERGLGEAGDSHRGLMTLYLAEIEDASGKSEDFENAKEIYKTSQEFFDRAKGYKPEEIRREYANAKSSIKQPEQVKTQPRIAKRKQAAPPKPKEEPQTIPSTPTSSSAQRREDGRSQPNRNSQPSGDAIASNESASSSSSNNASSEPSVGREPETPLKRPGEILRDRGGLGPRGPMGRPGGGSESFPPRFGPPRSMRGGSPGRPFGPGAGPRSREQAEAMIQEKRKRFTGQQGVAIYFKAPKDLPGVAKEYADKLGIKEYMASASRGEAKLMLRWSESVELLSKRIDFGEVVDLSEPKREIRVDVN